MLVNFCKRFLAGRLFFPLTIIITITLTTSLILQSLVVSGCTSSSALLRNLELLDLTYTPTAAPFLPSLLESDNGTSGTFHSLRVGYRSICIHHTEGNTSETSWTCNSSPSLDLGQDPLNILGAAQIYKDQIAAPSTHYLSLLSTAVALLAVAVHALPMVPSKEMLRRVAAGTAGLGALLSAFAMTLQHVTTRAVVELVTTVSLGGISVDVGSRAAVCGWVGFVAMVVAAACLGVLVVGDWGFAVAERREQEMADAGVRKVSGGRLDLEAARGFKEGLRRSDSGFAENRPSGGKGRFPIKPETVGQVASVAKKVHEVLRR